MKKILLLFLLIGYGFTGFTQHAPGEKNAERQNVSANYLRNDSAFRFVYMADIHLQPELSAVAGFTMAIDTANKLQPDFILTGGDLIMDALNVNYDRASGLFNLYKETIKRFQAPVYNTIGNHEVFGLYKQSGIAPTHPEYGKKMYEKKIGNRYYTFQHNGWKFMVLDGIGYTKDRHYIGLIDSIQIEWIRTELSKTDPDTPIAISVHVPFITAWTQIKESAIAANGQSLVVTNAKDVLDLFREYNLKLVLQGHLHFLEDIYVDGIHFITCGAVSSQWWKGNLHGLEEGFMVFDIKGEKINWQYIDYGWEAE